MEQWCKKTIQKSKFLSIWCMVSRLFSCYNETRKAEGATVRWSESRTQYSKTGSQELKGQVYDMKTVGERITELRKQKNMTEEEFGSMLGVSEESVSEWEKSGALLDVDVIDDMLGHTMDELAEQLPEETFEHLLKNIFSQFAMADDFAEYKQTIDSNNSTATALYTESGALWGNQNIGVIYRKSAKDSIPLLKDEDVRTYLAMLSDENVCKILVYLAESAKTFTASSVASKCDMTADEADAALQILKKCALVKSQIVKLDDEPVTVWKKNGFHKMLFIYAIMTLAKKAFTGEDNYYCFRGDLAWC